MSIVVTLVTLYFEIKTDFWKGEIRMSTNVYNDFVAP